MANEPDGPFITARITSEPISPAEHLEALPPVGAAVTFEGIVRDKSEDRRVLRLEYDCYRAMAERQMRAIAEQAAARWSLAAVLMIHRTGVVAAGDTSVVVSVCAGHRKEAFEACRWVIDELKANVAIWKKEVFSDGTAVWA